MKPLIRFARLSATERGRLLEAVAALAVAGGLLKAVGFARLARRLGHHMAESPAVQDSTAIKTAGEIRWAVQAAAANVPWKPVCLPQAIAAQWMLRRRGIRSTLYLGVDPGRQLDAHAWVRVGDAVVTGGAGKDRFVVVSTFA